MGTGRVGWLWPRGGLELQGEEVVSFWGGHLEGRAIAYGLTS